MNPSARNGGIDALRAIAALMVFVYHANGLALATLPGPLEAVSIAGNRGVTIFFVISGFVLYRPMIERLPNLGDYALRRATRILPAYLVALVGTALLLGVALSPAYLVFAQVVRLDDPRELMRVAWTLQAEVVYYAALPVVAWVLIRSRLATVSLGILVAMAAAAAANVAQPDVMIAGPWTAAWGVWAFLLGMFVARLPARWPVACAAVGAALVYGGLFDGTSAVVDVQTGLGGAFLVAGLRAITVPRALAWAGASLSYSFYLWHWPALVITSSAVGGLVLAIALATVSWFAVERPFLELARRRRSTAEPRAVPAIA